MPECSITKIMFGCMWISPILWLIQMVRIYAAFDRPTHGWTNRSFHECSPAQQFLHCPTSCINKLHDCTYCNIIIRVIIWSFIFHPKTNLINNCYWSAASFNHSSSSLNQIDIFSHVFISFIIPAFMTACHNHKPALSPLHESASYYFLPLRLNSKQLATFTKWKCTRINS